MADDKKPTTGRGGPKRTLLLGTPRPLKKTVAEGESLPQARVTTEVDSGEEDLTAVKGRTLPPQPVVVSVPTKGTMTTATAPTADEKPDFIKRILQTAARESPEDAKVLLDLLGPDLGQDVQAIIAGASQAQASGQPKEPEPVVVDSVQPSRDDDSEERRKEQEWADRVEARVFGFKTLSHTPRMAIAKPDPPVAPARRDTPPMRPIIPPQAPVIVPRAENVAADVAEETEQAPPQSIFEIESEPSLITEALQGVAESTTNTEEPSAKGAEEETMTDEKPKTDAVPAPAQSAAPEAASAPAQQPAPSNEPVATAADVTAPKAEKAEEEMPADDLIVLDDAAAVEQSAETAPEQPPAAEQSAPAQSAAPEAASAPEAAPPLEQPLEPEPQQPVPAPPSADPFAPILVMTGSDMSDTQRFELGNFQHYIIGRDTDCDLVLTALTVSRKHTDIYKSDGGYLIRDLGSESGTVLQGKKLVSGVPEPIHSNDRFDIAGFKFIFFDPAEEKRRADEARAAKEAAKTVAKLAEAKKKADMAVTTDLAGAPPIEESKMATNKKPGSEKKPDEKQHSNAVLWAIAAGIVLVIGAIWFFNHRSAANSDSATKVATPAASVAPAPVPAPEAPAVKPPPAETIGELQVADAESLVEDDPLKITDKGYKPAEKSPIAKYASGDERPRQPKDCFPPGSRLRAQDVTWCCANLIPAEGKRTLKDVAIMSRCLIWKEEAKLAALGEFNQ